MSTVSIITRTKNRQAFLTRALASVAAQTFPDFELIVVNDAGDPAQVEAALGTVGEDFRSRVKVVHNPASAGREAALEAGFTAANAPYFAVHDDDDSWAPGFLAAGVAHLQAHPEEVGVAVRTQIVREALASEMDSTEQAPDGFGFVELSREILAADLTRFSLVDTLLQNYVPPISQLLRRDVADRVGHWDSTLPVQADWEFNLRMLLAGPMGFIDGEPLAFWHHRTTLDPDTGNSVVTDAQAHANVAIAIRDAYVRRAAAGDPQALVLAPLLVQAEFTRRTQAAVEALNEHLSIVHDSISLQVGKAAHSSSEAAHGVNGLHANWPPLYRSLEALHETAGRIEGNVNRLPVVRVQNKLRRG